VVGGGLGERAVPANCRTRRFPAGRKKAGSDEPASRSFDSEPKKVLIRDATADRAS